MNKKLIAITALALSACAQTQYWVKNDANLQATAGDLHACRVQSQEATKKYTAEQLEVPCMTAKGYRLSPAPPAN